MEVRFVSVDIEWKSERSFSSSFRIQANSEKFEINEIDK